MMRLLALSLALLPSAIQAQDKPAADTAKVGMRPPSKH
jgi:hypothetical protein